ncbi:flagellar biosynthesis protein FlhF, partial [Achromobacter anxifer]|nr:flagellar biosynthesis protein FlhF [Achromobacter anxifer]
MKISRFFGANSRDVMRQVRQVLGPDALIVSNRSVDGGVEVLATVEGAFDDAAHEAAPRQEAAYSRQPEARQQVPAGSPAVPRFDAPDQGARAPAPVMPQGGYPAPSRSIAAYQTAYASSTQAEDETPEAQQPVASAPVAPVRVELPSLPPLRQMPAAGPAATPAGAATVAPQAYAAVATAGTAPVAPPAYPAAPAGTAQATPSAYSASPSTPAPAAPMPAARAPEALQSAPAPSMARMPDAPLRQPPAAPPAAMAADAAAGLQDAISALRGALE